LLTGRLVSLLAENQPPNHGVWAVYPQRRFLSAKVRQVIAHLRAGLAARPEYGP
jgi:DNA-binding transcriptional LysR family regulator